MSGSDPGLIGPCQSRRVEVAALHTHAATNSRTQSYRGFVRWPLFADSRFLAVGCSSGR